LGDERDHVEVEPPECRSHGDSQRGRHDHARVDTTFGADADRDDRLAQRDDHDQPVPLREMTWNELPAL
jgi:hypothetical protein